MAGHTAKRLRGVCPECLERVIVAYPPPPAQDALVVRHDGCPGNGQPELIVSERADGFDPAITALLDAAGPM